MHRLSIWWLLLCCPVLAASSDPCGSSSPEIAEAFDHLYNFNFPASYSVLDRYIDAHPQEPLPYAVRSSAYLFYELDRLGILESQFLVSDKRSTPRIVKRYMRWPS
jgi:hypothetical protein